MNKCKNNKPVSIIVLCFKMKQNFHVFSIITCLETFMKFECPKIKSFFKDNALIRLGEPRQYKSQKILEMVQPHP